MNVSIKFDQQVALVMIEGSVDALTAAQLEAVFNQQLDAGHHQLVADLSQVEYMSSAGLRSVLATLKRSRDLGGDFRLAAPQPGVNKVLALSGFVNIFKVFGSAQEAAQSFTAQGAG